MVDDKATTTIAITQRKKKQERIIISHPKGYQNVMIQHQHNPWLVPSLLPTPEQCKLLAQQSQMKLIVIPQIDNPHYLAVFQTL
jgi:hypothetical protein